MFYQDNFITEEIEKEIVDILDANPWRNAGRRRMQTYGYQYFKGDFNQPLHQVDPIPVKIANLVKDYQVNQLTVNEYFPGQGIDEHYDHKEKFGKEIIGISLLSGIEMIFKKPNKELESYYLKPRSIYIMKDEYRYDYTHRIKGLDKDIVHGVEIPRSRRISLTFRLCS